MMRYVRNQSATATPFTLHDWLEAFGRDLVLALARGERPPADGWAAHDVLRVVEAAYRSHASGRRELLAAPGGGRG